MPPRSKSILVLDPDPATVAAVREAVDGLDVAVEALADGREGIARAEAGGLVTVVTEYRLEGAGGLAVIKEIARHSPRLPIVMLTAHGSSRTAIEAIKAGAFDYLSKPAEPEELAEILSRAMRSAQRTSKPVEIGQVYDDQDTIIGRSRGMTEIYKELARVSAQPVSVLVRGETGTGKELIARAIYQHGHRAHRPFITVNCAAIPENLLESELFGHEKGAFTGATNLRIGKFEQAHNGTLFLDEIGDLDLPLQAKILRVLQQKLIQRVGGRSEIPVDARIITATHRNLEQMMEEGTFRPDLFFRINVVTLVIPPLRDRRDDIPALVDYFIGRYAKEYGIDSPAILPDAIEFLRQQPWPGNIRELENTLRKALLNARGYAITKADVAPIIAEQEALYRPGDAGATTLAALCTAALESARAGELERGAYAETLSRMERALFAEALRQSDGNQAKAARWLGIARLTLREKLRALGLHPGGG
ncbi:sigma-54 dependent transcriptional regulator [soil metagenome]